MINAIFFNNLGYLLPISTINAIGQRPAYKYEIAALQKYAVWVCKVELMVKGLFVIDFSKGLLKRGEVNDTR